MAATMNPVGASDAQSASQSTKRPYARNLSGAEVFAHPSASSSSNARDFERVDSRGEYQLAAAPPLHVLAGLQSVGMKARMAVEKGYDATTSTRQGSSLPPRSTFARTQSMPVASPNAFLGNRPGELQPFAATTSAFNQAHRPLAPILAHRGHEEEDEEDDEMMIPDEDANEARSGRSSVATTVTSSGSSLKRNADDVLAQAFMDDEENDSTVQMQSTDAPSTLQADRSFRPLPAPGATISGAKTFGSRRPFGPTQTLPATFATAQYLAGADSDIQAGRLPAASEAWRKINFDDFTRKDDF